MKCYIVAILMIGSISATAQRHHLFADVGLALDGDHGGLSLTYNYKLKKRLGIGGGFQGYNYTATDAAQERFVSTIFEDTRLYFPKKKHISSLFLDLGINLYNAPDPYIANHKIIETPHKNGFYTGLGYAYLRSITKRGNGPYASLKIISNTYKSSWHELASTVRHDGIISVGTLAISIGYKF